MPTLTFGIELEFICLHPDSFWSDDQKSTFSSDDEYEEYGAGPAIYKALTDRGVPAVGYESFDDLQDHVPSYSSWRVETDALHLSEAEANLLPPGWEVEAVEISSRKLHFLRDDWRAEIGVVLQVLKEVEDRGCRFITNSSTGFHVHIGRDGGEFIPLRVAKNVFQLCTAFERLIDELHASQRIELPEEEPECHYYFPLSFFHTYGSQFVPEKGTKSSLLLDRLQRIEQAQTYEDVGSFFTILRPEVGLHEPVVTGHNSTVNFDNLFPAPELGRYAEHLTGTIEFRQHAGTLNYLSIVAWVTLTSQIVEYCTVAGTSDFLDLVIRGVDPEYTLDDLLKEIRCSADVYDHYRNDAIIGVLGDGAGLTGGRIETPVDGLVEQNDYESERRASQTVVKAAIDHKLDTGLYGIDRTIPEVSLLMSMASAALQQALVRAQASGIDTGSEEGVSLVRADVLGRLAQLYRDSLTGRSTSTVKRKFALT